MLLQVKGLYKTCMCVDLLPPPDSYMLKQDGTPSGIALEMLIPRLKFIEYLLKISFKRWIIWHC